MANVDVSYNPIPGALADNDGYKLCRFNVTSAVANNDVLRFLNVKDVIVLSCVSEDNDHITFDAKSVSAGVAGFTVDASVWTAGIAATSIEGLALILE